MDNNIFRENHLSVHKMAKLKICQVSPSLCGSSVEEISGCWHEFIYSLCVFDSIGISFLRSRATVSVFHKFNVTDSKQ